jgi:hypothetical protein
MARRSTSQFKLDDYAYPIRVKFIVPPGGMGALSTQLAVWLKENLDHLAWSWGPAQALGEQATAYYFRSLSDAQRFVAAFPDLKLADGVARAFYVSPAKSGGPGPHGDGSHRIGNGWKQRD